MSSIEQLNTVLDKISVKAQYEKIGQDEGVRVTIMNSDISIVLTWDAIEALSRYADNHWMDKVKSKKRFRNSVAYELTRAGGNVTYCYHYSKHHIYRMAEADWETLPGII
ncbi:hypothetical protein [Xanthomonas phage X1]|nr:hypothetical protein [Xanthomonas phage X1]